MSKKLIPLNLFVIATILFVAIPTMAQDQPTADEQMAGLEEMCARNAEAHAEAHNDQALYERLGGFEKIHALTKEIVRLHLINEGINQEVMKVDLDHLAKQVAIFMSAGTGGPEQYTGRSMKDAHAQLNVTNASFLAAGHDIILGMQNLGYEQEEIDAVVCVFVSLKDDVILD